MEEKYKLKFTVNFSEWLEDLTSNHKARVIDRHMLVEKKHLGENRYLREKVSELKFGNHGGLRVYYSIRNRNTVVLLLAGGDKGDQNKEIRKAIRLNKEIKDEDL
jgi:putative addiction module killer protein